MEQCVAALWQTLNVLQMIGFGSGTPIGPAPQMALSPGVIPALIARVNYVLQKLRVVQPKLSN